MKLNRLTYLLMFAVLILENPNWAQCTAPPVNLGNDTTLCNGNSILLTPGANFSYDTYLWNNNSPAPVKNIIAAGLYWVETTKLGNNVIVNGDFELGNIGFSTNYTVGTGGTYGQLTNEGTYAINTSPSNVHTNFSSCSDHTPNPGAQMMIVNGASTPNTNVWCQTVAIQPNTNYQFGVWVSSALFDYNVAILQFSINGSVLGSTFSPAPNGCSWSQFFQVWNSGSNSSAQICIVNQNTNVSGNDFMIDDISFRPVCKSRDTIIVSFSPYPIVNLGPDQFICDGTIVTLDAQNPGSTFLWDDASNGQTRNVQSTGNYSVTVTNAANCSASSNMNLQVENPVNAGPDTMLVFCNSEGLIDLNTHLSASAAVGGSWLDPSGSLLGELSSSGNLNTSQLSGNFLVNYVKMGTHCPYDTAYYLIKVNDQPNSGPDATDHLCNDSTAVVYLNSHLAPLVSVPNHIWDNVGNTAGTSFIVNSETLSLKNLISGFYEFNYIQLADSTCVNDTAKVVIEVTENPVVFFTANKYSGCEVFGVNFYNQSVNGFPSEFLWTFSNGDTSSSADSVHIDFETPGMYSVTLHIEVDNLCTSHLHLDSLIEVYPDPIADFRVSIDQLYTDNPKTEFQNKSFLGDQYLWNFNDGTSSTEENPTHTFPIGIFGNYQVWLYVTSNHGCVDSTYRVILVDDQLLYFVPNAFTPDQDQYNSIFRPILTAGFEPESYIFRVYNRWGELIFQTSDAVIGWDGTFENNMVPEGLYTWLLEFTQQNTHEKISRRGLLTLIR